jgi:uncharacterized protein (DUF362 family)
MEKISVVGNVLDVSAEVNRCVNLIGGYSINKSDTVIIKPNICSSKNPNGMVLTDFRIIQAVVNQVRYLGCKVLLVESDNISGTAEKRAEGSGFLTLCDDLDAEFLNLSHDEFEEFPVADTYLRVPKTILDADYFINLPKIKTCGHTLVSLGIKNLYGVIQRKMKGKLHKHLDKILPFLAETIKSDLVIVDGLTCMEGNGPIIGNPKYLNMILAGTNLVAVDSLCSRIMGYNPDSIPHIYLSAQRGLGSMKIEDFEAVGDDWKILGTEFEPPYSLKATLKSWRAIREIYFS